MYNNGNTLITFFYTTKPSNCIGNMVCITDINGL